MFYSQKTIQNSVKPLRWSVLQKIVYDWKPLTMFGKRSILGVIQNDITGVGRERKSPNMVTKSDKGGTQYSDVTHSVLFFQIYTSVSPFSCFNGYHKFANDFALSGCFLSFGLLKYKGHDVTGNRPNPWVFTSKLFNGSECGTPLSIFAEHLSVFLLTTHQYICGTPVTIFGNTY